MLVRMKAALTGLYNGRVWPAVGDTIEVPEVVAVDLLAAGHAVPVKSEKVETATATPAAEKRGPGRPPKPKASRG